MCYYGRHANPLSAALLPKNRWPAFWYTAQRLSRIYEPQPWDGEVLAMFISQKERRHMWHKLLGPNTDIRIIESNHVSIFAEPALSHWREPLNARLNGQKAAGH